MKKFLAPAVAAVLSLYPFTTSGCTSFLLKGFDGGFVYGRTLEFGLPLKSDFCVFPRNLDIRGVGPDGTDGTGLGWRTKYGAAGMNALGLPVLIDGMNEKGLMGGLLNAPGTAVYQDVPVDEAGQSIASLQMLLYALTNFATVDEVKEGFSKIKVSGAPYVAYGNRPALVRMTLHDARGKSLVIEYLGGELVMTDNPTGAMTNDPPFRDQLQNIGNYANLSKEERPPLVINGASFAPPSSGSGLHGLPGDYLSPSRFIRAVFLSSSTPANLTTAQQVNTAFHILGSFDIPPGAVTLPASNPYGGGAAGDEITEWMVAADSKNLVYYVRMFGNLNIQEFRLAGADFGAGEVKTFKLPTEQVFGKIN